MKVFQGMFSGGMLLGMVLFPQTASAQLVRSPVYNVERLHWGMPPDSVLHTLNLRWFADKSKGSQGNFGSGRSDVFPRRSLGSLEGIEVLLTFEFSDADSGLVSVTLVMANGPGLKDIPSEVFDHLWDEYVERFGEEDSGGKTIPLIGRSKIWDLQGLRIKLGRISVPSSSLVVSYILQGPRENPRSIE